MIKFNYQTICHSNLLKDLPARQRDVILRRFGLGGEKETLEAIGRKYRITRERVRQIEEDGLRGLGKKLEAPICRNVFQYFVRYFKDSGSLKREDLVLRELGGQKFKNYVFFLLSLGDFERFAESEDFWAFWTIDKNAWNMAKKAINSFISALNKKKQPSPLTPEVPSSYIEISKNILQGPDGLYGLPEWPEVNPRGIKDKAYIIFKKEEKPLHFIEVASLINSFPSFQKDKTVISQTVHNELIKDPRFVLVGRGLYALRDWGYEPGVVREVISKVLEQKGKPMGKNEILERVLEQRQVKPNTILLNLQNKKYFIKNSEGKYTIRRV